MSAAEVEEIVAKGLTALDNDHIHLALVCFERALEIKKSPLVCSSLGFCIAAARGDFEGGIALCQEAVEAEPSNSVHYLNLGRVLTLSGRRKAAIDVFRMGMRLNKDEKIVRELDLLGTRKPPFIQSLDRKHFLNRWLGFLLTRLGFR
jgi:tetratricopeptide (TPR) repeat protein